MPQPTQSVIITGTGAYTPAKVLTNDDMAKIVDTSDEWIRTRSGISERCFAAQDETSSDMALAAAEKAISAAGIDRSEIDLIIVATMTPDMPFPSTA
jgi:3-oxoacyl-[acyl-carrier-protein] synthase-3